MVVFFFLLFIGYKIASVACPKIAIQLTSVFDKNIKAILPNWNKVTKLDNTRVSMLPLTGFYIVLVLKCVGQGIWVGLS